MGGVEDDVRVAGAAAGKALAIAVAQLGQALARRGQAASPVEEVQKICQAFELEQAFGRPRHGHAGLRRPGCENLGLETAFQVGMHLCLGQGAKSFDVKGLCGRGH